MSFIEQHGQVLLQQHEGNRQLASALAENTELLFRRLAKLLAKALHRIPGAYPF